MKWASTLEIIDIETGEVLNTYNKKQIQKEYNIVGRTKETIIINTEFGRIKHTWHVMPKPKQYKLL